jgi:hypothetical protein
MPILCGSCTAHHLVPYEAIPGTHRLTMLARSVIALQQCLLIDRECDNVMCWSASAVRGVLW